MTSQALKLTSPSRKAAAAPKSAGLLGNGAAKGSAGKGVSPDKLIPLEEGEFKDF